ncbi:MAG: hypothetical protein WBF33_24235 [Candidatus Nitrosopolaris sp.]
MPDYGNHLTEYRRTSITKEVDKYSQQLGIRHGEIPTIILTRKEWRALRKERTRVRRTMTHKLYGTIQPRNYNMLFLNVRKHRSLKELRNTIINQLTRSRFRDGKRNENLSEKTLKQILKGKRYPRYDYLINDWF